MAKSVRVLITDAETRACVAAARGLSAAGFEVISSATASWPPPLAHWSRTTGERILTPSPLLDAPGFIDALEQTVAGSDIEILLPGTDAALMSVSAGRGRLERHTRLALPSVAAVGRALDKSALAAAAERNGLAVPPTAHCRTLDDVRRAAADLGLPVLVKPVSSVIGKDRLRRFPARLISDLGQLEASFDACGGEVLVQQRRPGRVISFAGVRADGRLLGEAVSHYLRTWPVEAGSACYSVTIDAPEELRRRVNDVLEDIGWEGLFELELIEADGGWHAIDLNPRIYGSLALAIGAGANLPAIWCNHLLGSDPAPTVARSGVFYRWTDADLRHRLSGDGAEPPMPQLRRAGQVVHPHMRLSDPGPAAARAVEIGAHALNRRRERRSPGRGPTVVIGAGPNGLAAAAHLIDAKVETRCFGEPLEAWSEHMPAGMLLRSQWRSSHIASPGQRYSLDAYVRDTGSQIGEPRLSREDFISYGQWFARQLTPRVDPRRVSSVARDGERWRLTLSDGEQLDAARVVVAGGITTFGTCPEPFRALGPELRSHAYEHDDLSAMSGRRVAVIGSGQSALECAALLHEHGAEVSIFCRGSAIHWLAPQAGPATLTRRRARELNIPQPPSDIGGPFSGWAGEPDAYRRLPQRMRPTVAFRCIRPAGAAWLRPRLADVPVHFGVEVLSAQANEDGVELRVSDGSTHQADHVLLGTGYDVDVRRYPFLAPDLCAELDLAGGYPVLGPGFESSLPGLHFVGAAAAHSFGPLMRFVVGTWYTAPAVARAAAGRRQPAMTFSFRQAGVPLDRHSRAVSEP